LRIYGEADDRIISEMTKAAKKMRISRNELILRSIDQFLHPSAQDSKELDQLRTDYDQARTELVQARSERDQFRTDQDNRWKELNAQKSEIAQLKRDLEATKLKADQLLIERDKAKSEAAQFRDDVLTAKKDSEKFQEALKIREDDIAYFKSHISQLTQSISQLSLKPGEEEIKKKGWWRFWR